MRDFKYASVSYKVSKRYLEQRGIADDSNEKEVLREGFYFGTSKYSDGDQAETYLMIIDSNTGWVMEVDPSKVKFIIPEGVN